MKLTKQPTLSQNQTERAKVVKSVPILERAIKLVNPKKTDLLLDIGKFKGLTAFAFASHVAKVVAIDDRYDEETIRNEATRLNCDNIDVIAPFDLEQRLPFENGTFDIVTCRAIINQVHNTDNFLTEVSRVLKHEGKLDIWLPIFSDNVKDYWALLTNVVRADSVNDFTFLEIVDTVVRAGFEIASIIPFTVPRKLSEKISLLKENAIKERVQNLFISNKEKFKEMNFRWLDNLEEPSKSGWWHDFNTLEILAIKRDK